MSISGTVNFLTLTGLLATGGLFSDYREFSSSLESEDSLEDSSETLS